MKIEILIEKKKVNNENWNFDRVVKNLNVKLKSNQTIYLFISKNGEGARGPMWKLSEILEKRQWSFYIIIFYPA